MIDGEVDGDDGFTNDNGANVGHNDGKDDGVLKMVMMKVFAKGNVDSVAKGNVGGTHNGDVDGNDDGFAEGPVDSIPDDVDRQWLC